jgi:dephospho-CoA kinase
MFSAVVRAYLSGRRAVVLDVPLLFESSLDRFCGAVMVVAVHDPAVQMARLRARDPHLSASEAEDRVRSQGDVRDKARRAEGRGKGWGVVVWNDGGKDDLKREVERALGEVLDGSPSWWSWMLLACPPAAVAVGLWTYWCNTKINKRWNEEELKQKAKL